MYLNNLEQAIFSVIYAVGKGLLLKVVRVDDAE